MECLFGAFTQNWLWYWGTGLYKINSLTPWKFSWTFFICNFHMGLVIDGWGISGKLPWYECHWTSLMISRQCLTAPSHYLNQCWPSVDPYGVTEPQWAKIVCTHKIILTLPLQTSYAVSIGDILDKRFPIQWNYPECHQHIESTNVNHITVDYLFECHHTKSSCNQRRWK